MILSESSFFKTLSERTHLFQILKRKTELPDELENFYI